MWRSGCGDGAISPEIEAHADVAYFSWHANEFGDTATESKMVIVGARFVAALP